MTVFDASTKDAGEITLNGCLKKGQNVLEQILPLLILVIYYRI